MHYYRILDELGKPANRWFLGKVNFESEWDFWKYIGVGEVEVPNKELFIDVRKGGIPLDFTMADFELLIVNEKVKNILDEKEVQLIPVKVKGVLGNYYIVVTKYDCDCVDETNSSFDKWVENDPIRPDKAGEYKTIYKLIINPQLAHSMNIFRVKKYDSAVIVSDSLKKQLEKEGIEGVKFKKVTL